MSKADQLGAGRFGGGVRPISARRQAVAAATGVPTEGAAPPTELAPHRISLNPDNPRSALGDLTDLAGSLKTHGQKQAITVMNRDAYIKANPERETDLEPDTTHVVIDGSSRLAAAREAGLPTVKIMVSDDQGTTSEELLESALVANIHRQDLEELDEARALQRLLAIHGSQTALAKRLHRSQGWVSQRLALLNLTPELQARIGKEPIDLLRAVGNKPAAEQEAALVELKEQRAHKEEAKRERSKKRGTAETAVAHGTGHDTRTTDGYYGVIDEAGPKGSPAGGQTASLTGGTGNAGRPSGQDNSAPGQHQQNEREQRDTNGQSVPEPRPHNDAPTGSDHATGKQPKRFPYEDGQMAAMYLIHRMPHDEFDTMLQLLLQHKKNNQGAAAE
ncbi:ParB/RepB/Spo0J family partition protein [Streptomyces sp. NPDC014892]|uniref:ParB/RepB/Spo0J family partition protein n=1 Tax=Streptomyces sp. NPDC014892 TaxID=3364930 RepID=UPI0036FCCCAF